MHTHTHTQTPCAHTHFVTHTTYAALAEAATPYGIESFDDVLEPLWRGIRSLRGKVLAAFLKAIGHIIPLMDAEHAFYYTREVSGVLLLACFLYIYYYYLFIYP